MRMPFATSWKILFLGLLDQIFTLFYTNTYMFALPNLNTSGMHIAESLNNLIGSISSTMPYIFI